MHSLQGYPDLIAHVWYSLGFRPYADLTVVALRPKHRGRPEQLGPILRMSLPSNRAVWRAFLRTVWLRQPAARNSRAVLVWHGPVDRWAVASRDELRRMIVHDCACEGMDCAELIVVDDDRFWVTSRCDEDCICRGQGHSVSSVLSSPFAATQVSRGQVLFPDEAALGASLKPEGHRPTNTSELTGECICPEPHCAAELLTRLHHFFHAPQDSVDAQSRADEPSAVVPSASLSAAVVTHIREPAFRDALLFCIVPTGWSSAQITLNGDGSEVSALWEGFSRTAPPTDAVNRCVDLLQEVSQLSPGPSRCESFALLAVLAWWSGHGIRAKVWAQAALDIDADHRLALLVWALLREGIGAQWTRISGDTSASDPATASDPDVA